MLGSAEDVEAIVRSLGHEQADYVLSGLPFSTLPEGVGPAIAAATHRVIRPGGAFLTYQFSTVARDLTARHFDRVDTGMTWLNVPPCLLAWGWKALSRSELLERLADRRRRGPASWRWTAAMHRDEHHGQRRAEHAGDDRR